MIYSMIHVYFEVIKFFSTRRDRITGWKPSFWTMLFTQHHKSCLELVFHYATYVARCDKRHVKNVSNSLSQKVGLIPTTFRQRKIHSANKQLFPREHILTLDIYHVSLHCRQVESRLKSHCFNLFCYLLSLKC